MPLLAGIEKLTLKSIPVVAVHPFPLVPDPVEINPGASRRLPGHQGTAPKNRRSHGDSGGKKERDRFYSKNKQKDNRRSLNN